MTHRRFVGFLVALVLVVGVATVPAVGKPRPPESACPKGQTCTPTTTTPTSTTTSTVAPTTTTTAPTTTTTRPTPGGTVGYLGCAATHDAVQAAHETGPSPLWANYGVGWTGERDDVSTGGGSDLSPRAVFQRRYNFSSFADWTNPAVAAWGDFDRALAAHPGTTVVWWQPCLTDDWVRQNGDITILDDVLVELRRHWPGPIVVSATSAYGNTGPICKSLPAEARAAVLDWIASRGLTPGPDLSPLDATSEKLNRCHPNDEGRRVEWGPSIHGYGW